MKELLAASEKVIEEFNSEAGLLITIESPLGLAIIELDRTRDKMLASHNDASSPCYIRPIYLNEDGDN